MNLPRLKLLSLVPIVRLHRISISSADIILAQSLKDRSREAAIVLGPARSVAKCRVRRSTRPSPGGTVDPRDHLIPRFGRFQQDVKRAISIWALLWVSVSLWLTALPTRASNLTLAPDAQHVLDTIYSGNPEEAVALARAIEQARPQDPIGYLVEGEALWWERYCAACEIKYGIIEAWKHEKQRDDQAYFALTDKAVQLAQAELAQSETAEMHFYAGMGYALKVRVYGLRSENRNAARAAVNARIQMLRALELDPQMADATAALGIYNYYVDTLSPIVKLLRFFMGIPGGDKEKGVEQMQVGMNQGVLLAVDVRFILARALRQYDRKYEQALAVAQPLVERYPQSPLFLLLLSNLNVELGRNDKAVEYLHAVQQLAAPASRCATYSRELAASFASTLH